MIPKPVKKPTTGMQRSKSADCFSRKLNNTTTMVDNNNDNSSSSTSLLTGIDATLLRNALRLVHCIQKERGASCAYYASKVIRFETAMYQARNATNAAISKLFSTLQHNHNHNETTTIKKLPIASSLTKIRSLLNKKNQKKKHDEQQEQEEETTESSLVFHRIFVCFNTLISCIVHEYILKHDINNNNEIGTNDQTQSNTRKPNHFHPRTTIRKHRSRQLSMDINDKLSESWSRSPPTTTLIRKEFTPPPQSSSHLVLSQSIVSDIIRNNSNGEEKHSEQRPGGTSAAAAAAAAAVLNADPNTPHPLLLPPRRVAFKQQETTEKEKHQQDQQEQEQKQQPKNEYDSEKENKCRIQELLSLLHCFVQLKESTGVERAILSSLLAFGNTTKTSSSSSRLYNDLILEVENQRHLVSQLENMPFGPLRNLILDLTQLSPSLLQLQTEILTDFDSWFASAALEYDSETIWNIITIYVDKLHSLELLIIEELEGYLPTTTITTITTTTSKRSGMQSSPSSSTIEHMHDDDYGQPPPPPAPVISSKRLLTHALLSIIGDESHSSANQNGSRSSSTTCSSTSSSKKLDNILSKVESMPADELKKLILSTLNRDNDDEPVDVTELSFSSNSVASNNTSSSQHSSNHLSVKIDNALGATGSSSTPNSKHHKRRQLHRAASKEWSIDIYEIKFTKRIGQGASATTYLASWSGQNVAVKVASITSFGLEGWRTEVAALQKLHHPNVIRLLGSVYHSNPETYCLVLEYCNAGSLSQALRYPTPRNFFFHVSSGIATAMAYLHSRNVVHRDLKPGNVLCDGNIASGKFVVKVTDFGVATNIHDDDFDISETDISLDNLNDGDQDGNNNNNDNGNDANDNNHRRKNNNLTGETGTYKWMAPEVIRHEDYSYMADVYSFSIMLWQFVTREEPFYKSTAIEAAALVALQNERPPLPNDTPKCILELIHSCWDDDPNKRWNFDKIGTYLKDIQTNKITYEEKLWIEEPYGHPAYRNNNTKQASSSSQQQQQQPMILLPPKGGGNVKIVNQHQNYNNNSHSATKLISPHHDNNKQSSKSSNGMHRAMSLLGGFFGGSSSHR